ncbi:branched-chain amino acid ABC transporter permease [Rhizobium leguminosarum]|nr:branched-chain amino acid ABC transporter permease [Rhizobium leguminosarum]NKM03127.1 branched-chain amino acid ABC transporter permease [Rhizobium leguminosarum bv. viciae]
MQTVIEPLAAKISTPPTALRPLLQRYAPQMFFTAMAVIAPLAANALWVKVLTGTAIYTLTAASIALLYRRLGLVSLAQVALMGCGGWIALRLAHGLGLPFELNLLSGGLFAGVIGMVLAYPALRMRGLYLALITLMAAGGFGILINVLQFPNGGGGLTGFAVQAVTYMPRPYLAASDSAYFRYCMVVVAFGFLLIDWHERNRAGRGWALIRKSEAAAMAAGVDVTLYKVWGFALSGFLAGIAGALLAGNLQLLDARSFPPAESVMIFTLTIVGGAWHWYGAVIAALLYRLVPAYLNDLGINGDTAYVIFGLALIHALITAPKGLAGQLTDAVRVLRSREEKR